MSRHRQHFTAATSEEVRATFLEGHVLAVDTAKREVVGLAVPYDEPTERMHYPSGARFQGFRPGSAVFRANAKLFYGHDHLALKMPIGRIPVSKDTEAGAEITARLARTPKADEAYALLQPDEDGVPVLDSFSIGFFDVSGTYDEATDTYWHDQIDVFETSIVPDPQYQTAKVSSVLARPLAPKVPGNTNKEGTTMTEEQRQRLAALRAMTTMSNAEATELATLSLAERAEGGQTFASAEDVQTLSSSVDNLERRIATLGAGGPADGAPSIPFRTYGEFLQAVARGETTATEFLSLVRAASNLEEGAPTALAYAGGVIADLGDWVKDTWVGDIYRPLTERRRVLNAFTTRPLPASGMNVEYGKLLSDTTDVQKQVAEGDTLAYGKIAFTSATAPVETFGGWGEMTRQEVERSAMAVVEKFFAALSNRYAKVTEAKVRAAAVDPANATELPGAANPLADPDDWTDFLIDAAFALDDQGLVPDFALVGRDRFKELAKMRVGGGGDNYFLDRSSGSVSVTGLSGTVYNVPIIPVNSAGVARVCDKSAIATFEAGGAPFRLQDDDITNLTKAMSIYGYLAVAVEDKNGIIRPSDGV